MVVMTGVDKLQDGAKVNAQFDGDKKDNNATNKGNTDGKSGGDGKSGKRDRSGDKSKGTQ